MAVRANKKSKSRKILCAGTLNSRYLSTARNIVHNQGIELISVAYDDETGLVVDQAMSAFDGEDIAALVIPYPNFFGCLEDVDGLTRWAHGAGALVIGVVNPMALALLVPPGEWGDTGADIAVGDAQPFGIPVSSGGPYCGFMCCKQALVRQMPGRIIGRTVDLDGKPGFALTLQAREQHIRRAKATSNICTNQGLLMTAATIYLSLMGDEGLYSVAVASHAGMVALLDAIAPIEGVRRKFTSPVFHEAVIELPVPASQILARMARDGIQAGYDLGEVDAKLRNCMLTNVTETRTAADIARFASSLDLATGAF
jgi:glycine dehydrogenase subunit 1